MQPRLRNISRHVDGARGLAHQKDAFRVAAPPLDSGLKKLNGGADIFTTGRPRRGGGQAVRDGDADTARAGRPQPDIVIERRVGAPLSPLTNPPP